MKRSLEEITKLQFDFLEKHPMLIDKEKYLKNILFISEKKIVDKFYKWKENGGKKTFTAKVSDTNLIEGAFLVEIVFGNNLYTTLYENYFPRESMKEITEWIFSFAVDQPNMVQYLDLKEKGSGINPLASLHSFFINSLFS